jgi:hypothetical protein
MAITKTRKGEREQQKGKGAMRERERDPGFFVFLR